jgi:nicotinamide-nucleotide amidase
MIVEIVNTGSELMLGRVLNTHQQWLCRRLADLGYVVSRQMSVPDIGPQIQQVVGESLSRADLVITTGGLGPTSDDITRDLIAQLLHRKLCEDAEVLKHLERFFKARKRKMPERVRVQSLVPEGATMLPNQHGTAPGLAMEVRPNPFRSDGKASWLIVLPGPRRELRPMFDNQVAPLLESVLPTEWAFICRTLRTTGVPESIVEEKVGSRLSPLNEAGLELGYCANAGQVDVRLSARGQNGARLLREAEHIVREELGSSIYGVDDDELEDVIVRLLTERKQTLAIAESCTGGCIANRITNVPGASVVFLAGLVTYSNEAKRKFLGVSAATISKHGAVSEAVAREMAEAARRKARADFALSVTGIAGPSGGTVKKPVGTVFIGLSTGQLTTVEQFFNPYDRETFKQTTSQQALNILRLALGWGSILRLRS